MPVMFRVLAFLAEQIVFLYLGFSVFMYHQTFNANFLGAVLVRGERGNRRDMSERGEQRGRGGRVSVESRGREYREMRDADTLCLSLVLVSGWAGFEHVPHCSLY